MVTQIFILRKSAVHNLDFWVKCTSFLILLPLAAFLISPKYIMAPIIVFIGLLALSKIGLRQYWSQVRLYVFPMTVGLLVLSLFFSPGSLQSKLIEGTILSIRFALLISFGMLFSMVTNPIEIPSGFLRAKIPHKYGVTLMVGYRMMPLLTQKIQAIIEAQKTRGASFTFSLKKIDKFVLQIFSLIIPLLHATLEMSVRLSDALRSRGYDPEGTITVPPNAFSLYDYVVSATSVLILVISFMK